jgi:hypothetical protein
MANELWNVDSLELPATIVAANATRPTNTTILSNEHSALEITCVARVTEYDQLQLSHKRYKDKVKEIETRLAKEQRPLDRLASETKSFMAAKELGNKAIVRNERKMNSILAEATPIKDIIAVITTESATKENQAKNAKKIEDKATF